MTKKLSHEEKLKFSIEIDDDHSYTYENVHEAMNLLNHFLFFADISKMYWLDNNAFEPIREGIKKYYAEEGIEPFVIPQLFYRYKK